MGDKKYLGTHFLFFTLRYSLPKLYLEYGSTSFQWPPYRYATHKPINPSTTNNAAMLIKAMLNLKYTTHRH